MHVCVLLYALWWCHVMSSFYHGMHGSQSPRRRLVRIDGNVDVMQRHGDRWAPGGTNESKSERDGKEDQLGIYLDRPMI